MLILSHIVATFILGKLLRLKTRKQWFLAFLFGVGIDFIDSPHIIKACLSFFRGQVGFGNTGHFYFRSFIQEPISLLWVIPLALWFKTGLPITFFCLQALMDFICQFEKKPFWPLWDLSILWGIIPSGTKLEFFISLGLFWLILYIERRTIISYWEKYKNEAINRTFFRRSWAKIKNLRV